MPIEITLEFSDEFLAAVKKLKKRYRHIEGDIRPLFDRLRRGERLGDLLQGVTFNQTSQIVYKERLPNRDAQRGKSGGYRAIYYIQTEESTILLNIYSKSDQEDISVGEIEAILARVIARKAAQSDDPLPDADEGGSDS